MLNLEIFRIEYEETFSDYNEHGSEIGKRTFYSLKYIQEQGWDEAIASAQDIATTIPNRRLIAVQLQRKDPK